MNSSQSEWFPIMFPIVSNYTLPLDVTNHFALMVEDVSITEK